MLKKSPSLFPDLTRHAKKFPGVLRFSQVLVFSNNQLISESVSALTEFAFMENRLDIAVSTTKKPNNIIYLHFEGHACAPKEIF